LREILLYSNAFDDDDFSTHEAGEFQGQFHEQGSILFAAPELLAGWAEEDGFNVALHEFAHQVDFLMGGVDGTPQMHRAEQWARYVHDQIQRPDQNPDLRAVVDEYAWTDEAEFFACMTEVFFELPDVLSAVAPELYAFLADVWAQDPATRIGEAERMTISDFVDHRPRDARAWLAG
jgi:Mlc titration factor MtfA (ptsG expression regulator)